MMRYIIELAYNGSDFHGWQRQLNALTVQETIENAMNTLLGEKIEIAGCGRTDTGVHAKSFTAHFDSNSDINTDEFCAKLNSILCKNIVIYKLKKTNLDFHARFSAKKRTYEYYISTKKDPFDYNYSWQLFYDLDIEKMKKASQKLYDYTDFTSFSKLHTDVKTNNCKIFNAELKQKKDKIIFVISADRFLRNMVRAIVGTLVDVGRGKLTVKEFCEIIEKKDRSLAKQSAPAQGLFLVNVEY